MRSDRLFIDDVELELEPNTRISLNLQINDLADLKDRQSSFSAQFKIPKSQKNIQTLGWSNLVQSTTTKPYRRNGARLEKEGVNVLPNCTLIIDRADEDFHATIYAGINEFFSRIDGLDLSDIDMSSFDHDFTLADITGTFASNYANGFKYSIVNHGDMDNITREVDVRNMRASFFVYWLIDKIFSGAQTNKAGSIFSDTNFLKTILHAKTVKPYKLCNLTFDYDWASSTSPGYDPHTWVVKRISAWGDEDILSGFVSVVASGNEVKFANGVKVYPGDIIYVEFTNNETIISGTQAITDASLELLFPEDSSQDAKVGLTGSQILSNLGGPSGIERLQLDDESSTGLYDNPGWFDIVLYEYKARMRPGGQIPDLTQNELIKTVANQFALILFNDPYTNTIHWNSFQNAEDNLHHAIDYSDKLHTDNKKITLEYRLGTYGQKNYLRYKEDTEDKFIVKYTGDGFFSVDDETLNPKVTLIELPVAASFMGEYLIGEDVPVIEQIDEDGEFTKENVPRMLIDDTSTLATAIDFTDGTSTSSISANVPLCYFQLNGKTFNLGFDDSLIDDNYNAVVKMLNKVKKITAFLKLSCNDIEQLNSIDPKTGNPYWLTPRYFWQFSSYFILNKVMGYLGSDKLTKVELIRIANHEVCIEEFGPEILIDTNFPDPNLNWIESGDIGVSFTYGIPGVQKDNPGSFVGALSQLFSDQVSPVGKFKAVFTITGRTQGEAYVNIGASNGTVRNTDGTFTEILDHIGVLNAFNIYEDIDFDGIITLSSLRAQLNECENESN